MGRSAFKLHPIFVPFPIALLLGALAADLAFWGTRDPLCAEAASWLVLAAMVAAALSLVTGVLDGGWSHVFATASSLLLTVINVLMREGVAPAATLAAGPALEVFAAAILLAAGATAAERTAMQKASRRTLSIRLAGR